MKSISEIIAYNREHNDILTDELIATLDPTTEEIRENDIWCKNCGKRRTCFAFSQKVRCKCKCQYEAILKEDAEREAAIKARKIANMRITSLLGERYRDATFEKTEAHGHAYALVYNRCRKYCDVADVCLERGLGIYLYGNSGSGKTHLTACMANKLIDAGYSVLFTNFAEIAKAIKATFNNTSTETEQAFVEKLANVAFLFIDDFGTETVRRGEQDSWLQEKIFEIINARYNRNRPLIITSNYTLVEMMTKRGVAERTIQRIAEVSEPMELRGQSFRSKPKTAPKMPF